MENKHYECASLILKHYLDDPNEAGKFVSACVNEVQKLLQIPSTYIS